MCRLSAKTPHLAAQHTTIQPLSSEQNILAEAQAAQPAPRPPETTEYPTVSPSAINQPSAPSSNVPEEYESTFVAEPITYPTGQPTMQPLQYTNTFKDTSSGGGGILKKIVLAIVVITILGGVGYGVYHFFFATKITSTSLVSSTFSKTTYRHPDGWEIVPLQAGYEMRADLSDDKPAVRLVAVKEGAATQYHGEDHPSDNEWYSWIRNSNNGKEDTADSVRIFFRNGSKDCTSDVSFKTENYEKQNETTVGLYRSEASCTREDGTYIVKRHIVIGKDDGLYRHIIVGTLESDWRANEALFDAILDSAGQVSQEK